MPRKVDEWVGKTPDTKIPPRVKERVFKAHGGRCYLTGREIRPGDLWDIDHIVALVNEGKNVESNLAPVLRDAHRKKTAEDVAMKSKDRRVHQKFIGIQPNSKRRLPGGRDSKVKIKIGGQIVPRDQ
jgi:5-methylcytosine-specific restriction enzyme A